jgi:hypothetical protein
VVGRRPNLVVNGQRRPWCLDLLRPESGKRFASAALGRHGDNLLPALTQNRLLRRADNLLHLLPAHFVRVFVLPIRTPSRGVLSVEASSEVLALLPHATPILGDLYSTRALVLKHNSRTNSICSGDPFTFEVTLRDRCRLNDSFLGVLK